jgi:hypothetical protein
MRELELTLKLLAAEAMQASTRRVCPMEISPEGFSGWLLACSRIAGTSLSIDDFFQRLHSSELTAFSSPSVTKDPSEIGRKLNAVLTIQARPSGESVPAPQPRWAECPICGHVHIEPQKCGFPIGGDRICHCERQVAA